MSPKPREWTLEYDSNYDNVPPCVTAGPDISPAEMEVRVIEHAAYESLLKEAEALYQALLTAERACIPASNKHEHRQIFEDECRQALVRFDLWKKERE